MGFQAAAKRWWVSQRGVVGIIYYIFIITKLYITIESL